MILYRPLQILFTIANHPVYSYGVMISIAFLTAYLLILNEAKKKQLDFEIISWSIVCILIGTVVGARIGYIIPNLYYFIANPFEIFQVSSGGLASYGGFTGGVLAVYIYFKKMRLNVWEYLDLYAPYVALGAAIARIGCFLNYCCYGLPSRLPWALHIPGDVARHPTQIYLAITNLTIFFILLQLRKKNKTKKPFDGYFFAVFFILFGVFRFFVDFFRYYETYYFGLSLSQIICIFIVGFGIFILRRYSKTKKINGEEKKSAISEK